MLLRPALPTRFVASAQDARTPGITLARVRRLKAKGLALRSDIRSRLRESEAFCV